MKKRRVKTTIEIHEVYIIRQPAPGVPIFCSQCVTGDYQMVTPEEAAAVTGIAPRTIYAGIETGTLHYQEQSDGLLLVCLNSFPVATAINGRGDEGAATSS